MYAILIKRGHKTLFVSSSTSDGKVEYVAGIDNAHRFENMGVCKIMRDHVLEWCDSATIMELR